MADRSLVLLVEPKGLRHHHTDVLVRAWFRVTSVAVEGLEIAHLLAQRPAVIAAELDTSSPTMRTLAKRFRQHPQARLIPFIIYGHELRPKDIEDAARAGALWLQLEPADGEKLVAAVRGVVAASQKART